MMRISLASHIKDPLERLQAIRAASLAAKAMTASVKTALPTDFPSLGAPWLLSGMASLFGRSKIANSMPPLANVAISNVPGPKVALYMAGAKMLTYYPVSIVMHSLGLNVTVQSYNGSLDWGLIGCRKAMPDLPELAKYMQAAHQELLKLTPAAAVKAHETPPEKAAAPAPLKLVKTRPAPAHKATPAPAHKPAHKLVRAKRLGKAKQAA